MSFVSRTPPRGIAMPRADMLTVIRKLGLSGSLLTCLDAGDEASYSGSGQSWLDRSGNGHNFFRGSSGAANANDAVFNGTPGRRSAEEYWSFAGAQLLRADTPPSAMQDFHKANAAFTLATWWNPQSISANQWLFGSTNLTTTDVGFAWIQNSSGAGRISVSNGGGSFAMSNTSSLVGTVGAWQFRLLSVNEAAGAGGSFHQLNGAQSTFNGAYTSPSAASASRTFNIGMSGSATQFFVAGTLLSQMMMWTRALSQDQALAIYFATRSKFGV